MTELSYFQRYSQRENHVTNNVVLMLRMLYREHPAKLQAILEDILTEAEREDLNIHVGPTFSQQLRGTDSIPDAVVSQMPFTITVEVKPGEYWNRDQIKRHIKSARARTQTGTNILMLLSTSDNPGFDKKLYKMAEKANVALIHSTFNKLLDAIDNDNVVGAHESNLREIVDDFRDVLSEEDLLDDPYVMFAFGCSQTLDWNLKNNMYYDYLARPNKSNVLTGFYANKCVHALGLVAATVIGNPNTEFSVEKSHPTISDDKIIAKVIKAVKSIAQDFDDEPHRWYIYDELHKTNFIKSTPYGYFQGVWFHLERFLGEDIAATDLRAVAEDLKNKSFGDDRGWEE